MSTIVSRAFTLVELLLVIILISFIYFLSLKFIVYKTPVKIKDLYFHLYPNGEFDISKFNCKIYNYYNSKLQKEEKYIYRVKNGIGDSFLMMCPSKVYLFRPFDIVEFNSTDDAVKSMTKYLNEGIN